MSAVEQHTATQADGDMLTINGVTKPISQWAKDEGISRQLLNYRLRRGWSKAFAVKISPRRYRRLSDAAIAELRRRVASGEPVAKVAREADLSASYVRRIALGLARKGAAAGAESGEGKEA